MNDHFILLAERNPDRRLIYSEAIKETGFPVDYDFVGNGSDLVSFLEDESKPRPQLIVLDLTVPTNETVLIHRLQNADIKVIPFVVVTTEESEASIREAYTLSANSCIVWTGDFQQLVTAFKRLFGYWFETVKLAE